MIKRISITAIIVLYLAISAVIIFWERGRYFGRDLYVFFLVVFVGIPFFAVSLLGMLASSIRSLRKIRPVFLQCMGASLVIISLIIPLWISSCMADYDVSVAKSFCERLVPALEKIKRDEGRYPDTIDGLIADGKLPGILEDWTFYYSDGTSFTFTIPDCGTLMGGWDFSDRNPAWEYWD